jgi:5-methylcytosine-specific restriction endonuclease McrA
MSNVIQLQQTTLTQNQLGELIVKESRRGAERYGFKHKVDVQEMESWLISEIYHEIMNNVNMQNIKGIRHMIRLRSVDYMRELVRDNVSMNFTSFTKGTSSDDGFDSYNTEEVFENYQVQSVEDTVIESSDLTEFLDTLDIQDRQIVELSAGITDSLDVSQLSRVKDLIDRKAVCKCGSANCQHNVNVWFTTSEVGEILGLSRRQVQYPLTKMSEKALDFGLWFDGTNEKKEKVVVLETVVQEEQGKVCSKCDEFKVFDEYEKRTDSKDGHRNECKLCVKERKRQYRQENPEYFKLYEQDRYDDRKDYMKQYLKTEKGREYQRDKEAKRSKRTRAVGGDFLMETKKTIFKRDKGLCQCCETPVSMEVGGNATFDHKIPVYWGGKSTLENGQLLCRSCNSSKNNKLVDELLATLPNPDDNIVWEVMSDRFRELLNV